MDDKFWEFSKMKITVVLVILSWIASGYGAYVSANENDPEGMWAWVVVGCALTLLWFGIYGFCRFLKLLFIKIRQLTGVQKRSQRAFAAGNNAESKDETTVTDAQLESSKVKLWDGRAENPDDLEDISVGGSDECLSLASSAPSPVYARQPTLLEKMHKASQQKLTFLVRKGLVKWARFTRITQPKIEKELEILSLRLSAAISYVGSEIQSSNKQMNTYVAWREQDKDPEMRQNISTPVSEAVSPVMVEAAPTHNLNDAYIPKLNTHPPLNQIQDPRKMSIHETTSIAKPLAKKVVQNKLGPNNQRRPRQAPKRKATPSPPPAATSQKNSETHFIWLCDHAMFSADEKKFVEERGMQLNNFVRRKKTSGKFHKLLESIISGEVEPVTPAQRAWEKYIVRCDVELPREIILEEGFAGSRSAFLKMRSDRYRSRFY